MNYRCKRYIYSIYYIVYTVYVSAPELRMTKRCCARLAEVLRSLPADAATWGAEGHLARLHMVSLATVFAPLPQRPAPPLPQRPAPPPARASTPQIWSSYVRDTTGPSR